MYRSKRIVLVSHCMLNYNSKVERSSVSPDVNREIISMLLDESVGIIQLPCPELCHLGIKRWGHVREQLDTPFFRRRCADLFTPYLEQVQDYQANGYEVLGILGINGSPSCGVDLSCSGNWGGEFGNMADMEKVINSGELSNSKGIFIKVIESMLKRNNIPMNIIGIDECDRAFSIKQLEIFMRGEKR